MKSSVRLKIISIFVILQVLVLLFLGLLLNTSLRQNLNHHIEKEMKENVQLISEILFSALKENDKINLQKQVLKLSKMAQGRITIIATNGKVLADSEEDSEIMENHADRLEIIESRKQKYGWAVRYSSTLKIDMKYLTNWIEPYGYVRLAIPLVEVEESASKIFIQLLAGFVVAFIVFFILAWRLSESITEPIKRITQTAQKIAHGHLNERIYTYSNDEIGTLSRMFNLMASQLGETIKKITSEKERLATILDNMADGLIALNMDQEVIILNPAAAQMFGVNEEVVKGKSLIEINWNQKLIEILQEAYLTLEPTQAEVYLLYPREITLRSQLAPIIGDCGETKGMVLLFTDITELRRLERMRTEFVGNVSHELKTPLTSIRGYVETLLDMELDKPGVIKRFLGVINKESERLSKLIEDLLALSRLEGKKPYEMQPIQLQHVYDNIRLVLKSEAKKKKVDLKIHIPKNLPSVMGIEEQLNQVFINLIENGIKYTSEEGKVTVTAKAEGEWVITKVKDTGMGIPEEDIVRIFERFYRVDKGRSRQLGGTGLGLSIVKHIIKAHDGEISVESEIGVGSTFSVKLKRASLK
ncbi:MAG: HAMP domain-containing protein [Halanaerobiales bacterium]|nr:HAMP domain-containing protein [Halanaerobiales bacterium]